MRLNDFRAVSFTLSAALIAASALTLSACSEKPGVCAWGDSDCDGVPDDLGRAIPDGNGGYLQFDYNNDGIGDGLGVDTTGDGVPNGLLLDTNGDGLGDAVDLDGDLIPDLVSAAEAPVPGTSTGSGTATGSATGTATGSATGTATGALPPSNPDFGELPELTRGNWNAPILASVQAELPQEFVEWRFQYMEECPTDPSIAGVKSGGSNGAAVSEGIGYGMLITANLGSQEEFDKIAKFYSTAIQRNPSPIGLLPWVCQDMCGNCGNGGAGFENEATDADLDAAMALIQAEHRWGGGGYQAAALSIITKLRSGGLINCGGRSYMNAGNWAGCDNLNPSYFSPGYYKAFAAVDTAGAGAWNKAVEDAYWHLNQAKGSNAGSNYMWPDATNSGGTAVAGFSNNGYDAARVPWRIATDYAWTADANAAALSEWTAGVVDGAGYSTYATNDNSVFYGAMALSAVARDEAGFQLFVDNWLGAQLSDNAYYNKTLKVIYMMLAAGQFPGSW